MQVPPDVADFTGRDAELAELRARLRAAAGTTPPAVAISAIDGKPGVGESALAVHLAHGLAAGFPDGVLYVNLRGAEPERLRSRPAWPLAALAERLADARRRLDELAVGDLAVRSSFLLSYRALGAPTGRTFRLLGLLHGPDVAAGGWPR